jgi:glycosyltransferase involved in cell wall biosynthesis
MGRLLKLADHTARLLVLGAGPYEAELRRQVARLQLGGRVEIRGIPSSDRAGMAATLAGAALVTLLSEYETHPVALLEALALGRPLLVARNSGMADLAERGLARGVPDDATSDQIADAILGQLADPLRPAPVDLPTWDDCARELLALYRDVTGRAARTRP